MRRDHPQPQRLHLSSPPQSRPRRNYRLHRGHGFLSSRTAHSFPNSSPKLTSRAIDQDQPRQLIRERKSDGEVSEIVRGGGFHPPSQSIQSRTLTSPRDPGAECRVHQQDGRAAPINAELGRMFVRWCAPAPPPVCVLKIQLSARPRPYISPFREPACVIPAHPDIYTLPKKFLAMKPFPAFSTQVTLA